MIIRPPATRTYLPTANAILQVRKESVCRPGDSIGPVLPDGTFGVVWSRKIKKGAGASPLLLIRPPNNRTLSRG